MNCKHEIWENDTAINSDLCAICLQDEIERLTKFIEILQQLRCHFHAQSAMTDRQIIAACRGIVECCELKSRLALEVRE